MDINLEDVLLKLIKSIDLFQKMSDQEAIEIAKISTLNYYPKWTKIILQWKKPKALYILWKGKLNVFKREDNVDIKLGDIQEGEIFGEMSYLRDIEAMAWVSCSQQCDIWEIPLKNIVYSEIIEKAYETMSERDKENQEIFEKYKLYKFLI